MGNAQSGNGQSGGDSTDEEAAPKGVAGVDDRKVRKLEVFIAYAIFFLLGASILLPWSIEIVSGTYFQARLEGSPLRESSSNWVALTFTLANLTFLALANATQQGANLSRRITIAIIVMSVLLVLGIISTRIEEIDATLFFVLLIGCTILLSACASFLQNAVVALSSRFGQMYLQGILSGQGAVGLAAAVLQFFAALSARRTALVLSLEEPSGSFGFQPRQATYIALAIPAASIRTSAFTFFATVAAFSCLTLLAHLILIRLPLYRLVVRSTAATSASSRAKSSRPALRVVERKVRKLGVSIFWVFFVTLSVFPSITASILSVHDPADGKSGGLGGTLSDPMLFIPLGFIIFNAGDWIGRALPHFQSLVYTDWRLLMGASALRTVFIPLFLLCNVQAAESPRTAVFNSDTIFILLMILFSVSNGYVSTLIMLAAVVDPALEHHEVDIATTCLAFYLTSGLAAGSFVSFGVRASVCHCNPFA